VVAEGQRAGELIYEIQHPLIRDVIYQQISGARRRALHRQAARSLLERGRLAEAALHFARSATPGDDEAVRVLLDAMRQAEQREAFRETLDLLSELVEILPPADPRWLDVLGAMYWQAEWVVDHRAEARAETAIRALRAIDGQMVRSADDARRATVKFRLAYFLAWGTGELQDAEHACREAVQLFEAAGKPRQALLARREIGWIMHLRGDIAGMAAESARVVEAADVLSDRSVAMQSGPLFEQAKMLNPAFRDTILVELEAFAHWIADDFIGAVAAAREAAAWAPGGARRRALGLACGGLAAAETGDIREAERLLGRAREALGGRDWAYFFLYTRYGEAVLTWHAGRPAECAETLAEVTTTLRGMDALAVSVTIPLAPRTARAIDLAIGERTGGPVFLAADGRRLDRHRTGWIVRKLPAAPGSASPSRPTRSDTPSSRPPWMPGCHCGMCRRRRRIRTRAPRFGMTGLAAA
jgi:hypothetical protein